jgi:hypothetical protein
MSATSAAAAGRPQRKAAVQIKYESDKRGADRYEKTAQIFKG